MSTKISIKTTSVTVILALKELQTCLARLHTTPAVCSNLALSGLFNLSDDADIYRADLRLDDAHTLYPIFANTMRDVLSVSYNKLVSVETTLQIEVYSGMLALLANSIKTCSDIQIDLI